MCKTVPFYNNNSTRIIQFLYFVHYFYTTCTCMYNIYVHCIILIIIIFFPVSPSLFSGSGGSDEPLLRVHSQFQVVLKQMGKRDTITKLKVRLTSLSLSSSLSPYPLPLSLSLNFFIFRPYRSTYHCVNRNRLRGSRRASSCGRSCTQSSLR